MTLKKDWNYVKSAMRTPCDNGSIGLYVETGIVSAGIAAMELLSFGCREPLKFAAGRGQFSDYFGSGNRRGTMPPHRRPKTPKGVLKPPTVSAPPNVFWALDAVFERVLFYWFLAEVTKDFYLNWTSLLMAANGCGGPAAGHCVFNVQPQVIGPNPTDMLIGALPDCHGVLSDIRAFYIPQGLTASVGYHVNSQPWAPQPNPSASLSTYLSDDDLGTAYGASEWNNSAGNSNGTVGHVKNIAAKVVGLKKITLRGVTGGGYAWVSGGKIHVTLQGHQVNLFPVSDCFKDLADKKDGHRTPASGGML